MEIDFQIVSNCLYQCGFFSFEPKKDLDVGDEAYSITFFLSFFSILAVKLFEAKTRYSINNKNKTNILINKK